MYSMRGVLRLFLIACLLIMAALAVMATAWLPLRIHGYRLSFLILGYFVRCFIGVLGLSVQPDDFERLRSFNGFVFANHLSYLDILVILAVTPVRFLAKDEVRKMPFVGQIARAIGCVFVERTSKESRQRARLTLARMNYFPPIVVYPEGKRGDGTALLPFRYGAFEIATDTGAAILPCILTYDNTDAAVWQRQESIGRALWRMARQRHGVVARISLLAAFQPEPGSDSAALSETLQAQMTAVWAEQQSD